MDGWLDSHCHILSEEFDNELDELLKRADENDVKRFLVVCCSKQEAKQASKLVDLYPQLDIATGFHPEDTDKITKEDFVWLEEMLKSGKFTALGEIGLDYHWVSDNKEAQKDLFIRQIELANKYHLPVLIHTRDAMQDTFDILKTHRVEKAGIMHCYPGSYEMAKEYLKLGYYLSFAGPVTFKNAREPKEVAAKIPLDRILIETDCPYMTPVPFRGKRNEPMYVAYTGAEIARLRGIREEELKEAVSANYIRLFDKKGEMMG